MLGPFLQVETIHLSVLIGREDKELVSDGPAGAIFVVVDLIVEWKVHFLFDL